LRWATAPPGSRSKTILARPALHYTIRDALKLPNREGEALCGMVHKAGFNEIAGRSSGPFALVPGEAQKAPLQKCAALRANSEYHWHQTRDCSRFCQLGRSGR
jgi:hypothetical protein